MTTRKGKPIPPTADDATLDLFATAAAAESGTGVPPVNRTPAPTPKSSTSERVLECGTLVPLCAKDFSPARAAASANADAAPNETPRHTSAFSPSLSSGHGTKVPAKSGTEVPHSKTRSESSEPALTSTSASRNTGEPPVPLRAAAAPAPAVSAARVPQVHILSVSEFTARAKGLLEGAFASVTVRGECSNLRRQSSGHVYFTLKDAGSQLSAVLFRGDALRSRCQLRDGIQVIATGAISVYEPRGTYQLIVRHVEEDGIGRLQREFERLKQKLAAEGLFDRARKRPLPALPRALGIVTSPTGAALQDFLRILRRRDWRGRVVVLPARVQGAGAAAEIAAALGVAARLGIFDLLIVARGGGSLEDLWPFNEEAVARAVAASPIPVVSAVGHEIDFTLSDFAADVRAETPSAAAELVSSGYLAVLDRAAAARQWLDSRAALALETLTRRAALALARLDARSPARRVESGWLRLDDLRNRLRAAPALAAQRHRQHLAALFTRLEIRSPENQVRLQRARLDALAPALDRALRHRIERHAQSLDALGQRLRATSIQETLRRGYALVRDADGHLLATARAVPADSPILIQFADGLLPARTAAAAAPP